jgi:hypothetical protein
MGCPVILGATGGWEEALGAGHFAPREVRPGSPHGDARDGRTIPSVKGDRVEVVIDTGDGVRTFEIDATRAGRKVEVSTVRGVVEVAEVTRTGKPVRTGRFMQTRVVALVEHPAGDSEVAGEAAAARRRRRQAEAIGQERLL